MSKCSIENMKEKKYLTKGKNKLLTSLLILLIAFLVTLQLDRIYPLSHLIDYEAYKIVFGLEIIAMLVAYLGVFNLLQSFYCRETGFWKFFYLVCLVLLAGILSEILFFTKNG